MAEGKVLPYLDIPLQHASPNVLKAMRRPAHGEKTLERIRRWREICPDLTLRSTFIVGFPGETEEDFEATLQLVRDIGYASVYSFKYSARPGTPAANMQGLVHEAVKDERLQRLQNLLNEQQLAFNQACVGKTTTILLDRKGRDAAQLHGRTPYNQSMHVNAPENMFGQIVEVMVTGAYANSLGGELARAAA
jgi:tRNA-2-methylthio-N6-dimethylallyladenosine synthase